MVTNYEHVKRWRKRTRTRLVAAFNSECGICKYRKCEAALEFHHMDPSEKEFTLSNWRKVANWSKLVREAKKCVLLCSNCHREVHAEVIKIPEDIQRLNLEFEKYKVENHEPDKSQWTECPVCNTLKAPRKKYCSTSCSSKSKFRVDWDKIDLYDLYVVKKMPITKIADSLNISDPTVHKRLKKIGLK